MARMTKQFGIIAAMATAFCFCLEIPAYGSGTIHKTRDYELEAVVLATAVTGTILSESAPRKGLLHSGGCYVWQQPGVALAITSVWHSGEAVQLYFNPGRFHSFLTAMPGFSREEPFLHPPEPDNSDEFYIEPQVYLLDSAQSRSRLSKYMEGYEMWMGFNEGAEFIEPKDEALLTDFAVVYIDSSGPLEFHFRLEDGELKLQHLFLWDYFSA